MAKGEGDGGVGGVSLDVNELVFNVFEININLAFQSALTHAHAVLGGHAHPVGLSRPDLRVASGVIWGRWECH